MPESSQKSLANWARDIQSFIVWREINEATGGCIMLKGATFAELLYTDGVERPAGDIDLLLAPSSMDAAVAVLKAKEYEARYLIEDALGLREIHASTYSRKRDGAEVDLHTNLHGLHCSPETTWEVLSRQTRTAKVGGQHVEALNEPASALLVALHVASHGPDYPKPLEDLRRGIAIWPLEVWEAARDLARQLNGLAEFAVGLSLRPEGHDLLRRLDLQARISAEQELTWAGAPWGAHALQGLASGGWVERRQMLRGVLFPPPRSMRMGSRIARLGRFGLALAYLLRPIRLLLRLPGVVLAWRRAQRT